MSNIRLGLATAVILISAMAAGAAVGAGAAVVDQSGLQFNTASVSVKRGQSVTFRNSDRTVHNITVTGAGMNFNGGLQKPGDDVDVLFTKAGVFNVTCGIHPKMKMTVQAS